MTKKENSKEKKEKEKKLSPEEFSKKQSENAKGPRGSYDVKPTLKQADAVKNWLSGDFDTKKEALLDAGYSESTSKKPGLIFGGRGVRVMLRKLDERSKEKFSMPLYAKIVDVYLEALEADKIHGHDNIEVPDHKMRIKSAENLEELMRVKKPDSRPQEVRNQYNFFSIPEDKQKEIKGRLIDVIKGSVNRGE